MSEATLQPVVTIHEPRAVPASRGWGWLKEGFAYFLKAPLQWLGIVVVLLVITLGIGLIPLLGSLANAVLPPVWSAGLMLGCHALHRGEPLQISHVFGGFGPALKPLVLSGLLMLLLQTVVVLVLLGPGIFAMAAGETEQFSNNVLANPFLFMVQLVVVMLLMVPISAAALFSPALIVLAGMPVVEALKISLRACFINIKALLVWGAIAIGFALVASLTAGLGFLVLVPMMVASGYLGFREMFVD